MQGNPLETLKHAIIVAGHAPYIATDFREPLADFSWVLSEGQKGEPRFYLDHIKRGVELVNSEPDALLIFSGGQTRESAGPRSEALGYFLLAQHVVGFGSASVPERATTEEFARDSFENVLFGICRFREFTGNYPEAVTVVSWAFKEERFSAHREAIRWPSDKFRFVGVNNPIDLATALAGEEGARADFAKDPYGTGAKLSLKRKQRNPMHRQDGYRISCPEVEALLRYASTMPFSGPLPWNNRD
jgi:hypothetical protein